MTVIFFDLGQTLIELSSLRSCMYNSLKKHLPQLPFDYDELVNSWGHGTHKLFLDCREKSFMDTRKMHLFSLREVLKSYKSDITDRLARNIVEEVWMDFIETSSLYPDVLPVLYQLKQSGYVLGLITDSDLDVAEGIIRRHNLTDFFEVKVVSGEVKAYKPNPLLFTEAIKLAKCDAYEGVYVGDSEVDVKGAADVGLSTVIVKRNEIPDVKIGFEPDFEINSLMELPKILLEINKI